jgi:hypothetical protein
MLAVWTYVPCDCPPRETTTTETAELEARVIAQQKIINELAAMLSPEQLRSYLRSQLYSIEDYRDEVRAYLCRRGLDNVEAIIDEAFATAREQLHTLTDPSCLKAWLFAHVGRVAQRHG